MPIVVVLPVPLTPTTMITVGSWRRSMRALAGPGDVGQQLDEPLGAAPRRPRRAPARPPARAGRRPWRSSRAPTSAMISASSRRSQVSSSSVLEQRRLDLGAERLARLGHVLAQAAEEPAALLGLGSVVGGRGAPAPSPVMKRSGQSRAMAVRDDSGRDRAPTRPRRPAARRRPRRRDGRRDRRRSTGASTCPGAPTRHARGLRPAAAASFLVGSTTTASPVAGGGVKRLDDERVRDQAHVRRARGARARARAGAARRARGRGARLGYATRAWTPGAHQPHAQRALRAAGYGPIGNFNANPFAASGARSAS